jgi:AcrR family transcriptional regulator
MPRGFNERDKASIHANLIDAGRAKLATVGMHKTSVDELARAAHISKGAFYRFFPSKEALFITLFAEAEREYRDKLRMFARRPGRSPSARLLAFFRDALGSYRQTPSLSKVSREDMAALLRALSPDGMRPSPSDEEAFAAELLGIFRENGVKVRCKPLELSSLMQAIFLLDLSVQGLSEAHAQAVDLMLIAVAEKLAAP